MTSFISRVGDDGVRVTSARVLSEDELADKARRAEQSAVALQIRDLSPAEFRGMLASEELLGDVWDAMRADLKGKADTASKDMRFALAANRSKDFYTLAGTLKMVGKFRSYAQSLYPGTDLTDGLSDATITAAWKETVARVGT
ncbi:hypothetical protein [Parasedimentitalea psychrophila]|uniref:Uncharacterized protein n=1 Tax=Parasedimentitalea psychrophila TaxID=2997337 RepID=A0A9Y2KUG7_9RHOB|nr:hypothetical protein [Parasedimentitalea psychrophila]WIY23360.1 hypothetical protein QPJ95_11855 [Parasedimentitalea psychrophila]